MTALILSAAMLAHASATSPVAPTETIVAQRVYEFATQSLGKKIGRGECADLNFLGLEAAHAKPFGTWQDQPSAGDYVWGRKVGTIAANFNAARLAESLIPGDMLQFRDVTIVEKVGRITYTSTASHHSAVLDSFDQSTGRLTILEQNSNGKRYVTRRTFPVSGIQSGSIWVYRPQPQN